MAPSRAYPPRRPWLLLAIPFVWLSVFVLAPLLIVVRMSLSDAVRARPPYAPVFDWSSGLGSVLETLSGLDLENYQIVLNEPLIALSALSSIRIAALSTVLALLIAFPLAHAMAKAPRRWQGFLITLVVLPFWTSFLIRVYAWIGILKPEGLLNQLLLGLGLIGEPLLILNTDFAVVIGIVYSYLPFMVLPIYASLERFDRSLVEAALDLGATPLKAFWLVVVPNVLPGIIAGSALVFIPAMGEFVVPDLLGGSTTLTLGRTLWNEFFANTDWPLASAVAVVLLALVIGPILVAQRARRLSGAGA